MRVFIHLTLLTFSLGAYGQKVADIDLTQPLPPSHVVRQATLSKECQAPQFTNSDGEIVSQDGRPELELQLTILNGHAFAVGDRVRSQIIMRNIGAHEIEIPMTIDPQLGSPKAGSLRHEYDLGWFEVEMTRKAGRPIRLESESLSRFLYGSASVPRTAMLLEPGQWMVAKFDFLLEQDRKSSSRWLFEKGRTDLAVHWRQAHYEWQRDNCKIETGYYNYDLKEETKPVSIEVLGLPLPLY